MDLRRQVRGFLLVAILVTVPANARVRTAIRPDPVPPPPYDLFSAAEPTDVRTLHLDLDLDVDFESNRLIGSVTHTIVNYTGTERFIVDTRGLTIHDVTADGMETGWSLSEATKDGQPLVIDILPSTRKVRIEYETSPDSRALSWLTPLQTLGDLEPMLYTLVEPDRAREWIPLQDTPGVRSTYEATIQVPEGLLALMSAENQTTTNADGIYEFSMSDPIPAYLIALAVGRFEFHSLDERTGIYVEPEVATEAAWDLQYVPEMVDVAEDIFGPYPFERYDLLLLPPGFGAGGMENPGLNFINFASAVSGNFEVPPVPATLIAHELAHSWAGDLATCATWSDTWLNEGLATYYAGRIIERMAGPDRAEIGYYWDRLNYEGWVQQTSKTPEVQVLHRAFQPGDSPSVFNNTSYAKGSIFLKTLEDRLGRQTFDQFTKSYFRHFVWRWVDDEAFLDHLSNFTTGTSSLQLDQWVYGQGLPSNVTAPTTSKLWDRIEVQSSRFRSGVSALRLDTTGWTSFERNLFLWQITNQLSARIAEVDGAFGFSSMKVAPQHWYLAVADSLYEPGMPMLERYLLLGGWNSISIFQRFASDDKGKEWAIEFYETARPHYVPSIRAIIDQILGYGSSSVLENAA